MRYNIEGHMALTMARDIWPSVLSKKDITMALPTQ